MAPLGHVLHLGAGSGDAVPLCLEAAAHRIVLMEPDPTRLARARLRSGEDDRVQVIEAAAGVAEGTAQMIRYSLPELSSFREPAAIVELYPGLQIRARIEVAKVDVATIAHEVETAEDRANLLILDAMGEEVVLLERLAEVELLERFDHILLRLPVAPLYRDSASGETLAAFLRSHGYALVASDESDPDRPEAQFHRSAALAMRLRSLDSDMSELVERNARNMHAEAELARSQDALATARRKLENTETALAERREDIRRLQERRGEDAAAHEKAKAEVTRLNTLLKAERARAAWTQARLRTEIDRIDAQQRILEASRTPEAGG